MNVALVLATWLHTLAFVIAWGYYGILGRVVLPALEQSVDGRAQGATLVAVERRAVPLVLLSAVLFTVSGTYLLVVDPHYAGLGNVLASAWTILMLGKHVLVVAFIALAVIVDRLIRSVAVTSDTRRRDVIRRLRLSAEGATAVGAVIVLLTALAQAPA